jgi:O-antigen/teichoic acid export membrane protein
MSEPATAEVACGVARPNVGASARASLLWGGGFTLLRDIAQFGVMLVLVRLLTPADYGTAALAQSIFGVVSVVAYGTFSNHALQLRNPDDIDWQAHFTSAVVLNTVLIGLVLLLAFGLSFSQRYSEAALPLAALSVVFLIEIPGTLRHRMLEAHHDWKRFRLLLIIGTFLGLGSGLLVGLMGGGAWALIVQVPMLGLPAAIDLLFIQRFRPDWSWSWARWQETFHFGIVRLVSGVMTNGRHLAVAAIIAASFDLATLGIFSRAVGMAALFAGRIGGIASSSLYPVITRADPGSEQMRRIAAVFLKGVCWSTILMATFASMTSPYLVDLLYGDQWHAVAPLVPLTAAAVAANSVLSATTSLLLANNGIRACFWLDAATNLLSILAAVILLPYGPLAYLQGLVAINIVLVVAAQALLVAMRAADLLGILSAIVPCFVAAVFSALAVLILRSWSSISLMFVRLALEGAVVALVFVSSLRILFPRQLDQLITHVPASKYARYLLILQQFPR